jgi:periplasmic divalent cation tolerance protein
MGSSSPASAAPADGLATLTTDEVCVVQTTLPDAEQATQLAHAIVSAGLGACVQIDSIRSVYRWKGQVQEDAEWRLSIKTRRSLFAALERWLREQHPYETPEIICLPLLDSNAAYLQWVAEATRP